MPDENAEDPATRARASTGTNGPATGGPKGRAILPVERYRGGTFSDEQITGLAEAIGWSSEREVFIALSRGGASEFRTSLREAKAAARKLPLPGSTPWPEKVTLSLEEDRGIVLVEITPSGVDWKIAYFTLSPGNYTWALGVQEQVVVHLEAAGCRTKRIRFHRASCSATGAALSSVPSGVTVALSGHAGILMAALPCASFTTCGLALGYWFGRRRRAKSRTVISLRGTPSRMSKPHRLSPLERVGLVASIATIVTPFITVWALLLAHADAKAIPQRPTQETSSAPAIFSPTVASPEKSPTPPSK